MPQIGDIRSGTKLGYKAQSLMIWIACPDCGKEKWIKLTEFGKGKHLLCQSCAHSGQRNSNWTGGKLRNTKGYVHIWLPKNSPYYPMTDGRRGRVLEHRLIVAQSLGRCLNKNEVVHHRNGIRSDNRIENLELISSKGQHNTHNADELMQQLINEIKHLTFTIDNQSKQIKYLQWQLKQRVVNYEIRG